MVKTLRITSVVAVLLAIAVFALPVKYGVKTDENIQKFLNSPSVLEKFKAISGNRIQTPTNQVPPLVQQSEVFAKIIDPPVPVTPPSKNPQGTDRINVPTPPTVKPQFTVISTSYFEAIPELSQALINEPGKGNYWVRQSSTVNHLLIEQIKDGSVIVRNGQETFEIKNEEKKFSPTPAAATGTRPITAKGGTPPPKTARGTTTVTQVTSTSSSSMLPVPLPSKTQPDPDKSKRVEDLVEKIKLLGSVNNDSNNPTTSTDEKAAQMQKLLIEFKNSNINVNEDEAKKLADLGEMLETMKSLSSRN